MSQLRTEEIHRKMVRHRERALDWFKGVRGSVDVPFYSSYDIRDSGFKVVNVDANIYPAGFNNICPTDRESAPPLVREYLDRHYRAIGSRASEGAGTVKNLMLITEEHTNNGYYWDNVHALKEILVHAGLNVCVAIPRLSVERTTMPTASGKQVDVVGVAITDGQVRCSCFDPDIIVSNNDFSEFYSEWGEQLDARMNPPRELGWWQRKKSNYFTEYNRLASELAQLIELDPWLFTVRTELFSSFDMSDEKSRSDLAQRVELQLDQIRSDYKERGIQGDPVVFVKNNSGTYGLAVMRIASGDEILSLNNKSRKKMKAAKGGKDVEEVIIQEGVPSIIQSDGITAEPTLYLFGCQLAGGFLRTHSEKGPTESLNSPGAVYKRLCVSDLEISGEVHPMENVYGWIARLGVLAIGRESAGMAVNYVGYNRSGY